MFKKFTNAFNIVKEMRGLPEVKLSIFGTDYARSMYHYFTKPHPRYRVFQNKKWGAALIFIPNDIGEYLKGKSKQVVRTNRSRCLKNGYYFGTFQPMQRIDEIMNIHYSAPYRQGKPISNTYLNKPDVLKWLSDKPSLYGVFDNKDILRAYAHVPIIGDLCIINRLLGHDDCLADGIMYLLISEIINQMIMEKQICGYPKWIMYDTFFGAQEGLRYFKERLGFAPYKVIWKLDDKND